MILNKNIKYNYFTVLIILIAYMQILAKNILF